MTQIPASISTRISHRFTKSRGWCHSTSVQITMGDSMDPSGKVTFPRPGYDDLLTAWTAIADAIGRAENKRRNKADGWVKKENA